MKRTIIKLTILLVIIASLVTCIVLWKEAKLTPPNDLTYENEHKSDLENSINKISTVNLEDNYQECVYKLKRYEEEGLVDNKTINQFQKEFMDKYVPLFVEESNKKFQQEKWDKEPWNHKFMKNRIAELNKRDKEYNNNMYSKQLGRITEIITKYDKATDLSTWTRYRNIGITIYREKKAAEYKADTILRNCTKLVEKLNALPGKIRDNHLDSINKASESFVCDNMYNFKEYDKKVTSFYENEIINGYNKHYNDTDDTEPAKQKLLDIELYYLTSYVNYIIDTTKFINFDSYDDYDDVNTFISECLKKSYANSISSDAILKLHNKLVAGIRTEEEFNGIVFRIKNGNENNSMYQY